MFWRNANRRCILFKTKDGLEVRLLTDQNLVIASAPPQEPRTRSASRTNGVSFLPVGFPSSASFIGNAHIAPGLTRERRHEHSLHLSQIGEETLLPRLLLPPSGCGISAGGCLPVVVFRTEFTTAPGPAMPPPICGFRSASGAMGFPPEDVR
jgi:hypothetical protein